ncbi:hypothetical protein ANN_20375 [Periplaneta americana]|uniref:Uncharacterized protein n=1 Tax=Periplaneta americana TaxID=6978 RepID=A0ABQ8SCN5_PERAM|nr:hypothetical protein ANN_20375 [Periplaneta americana]
MWNDLPDYSRNPSKWKTREFSRLRRCGYKLRSRRNDSSFRVFSFQLISQPVSEKARASKPVLCTGVRLQCASASESASEGLSSSAVDRSWRDLSSSAVDRSWRDPSIHFTLPHSSSTSMLRSAFMVCEGATIIIKGSTLKKKSPGRNSIALRLSEAAVRSRVLRLLSLGPFEGRHHPKSERLHIYTYDLCKNIICCNRESEERQIRRFKLAVTAIFVIAHIAFIPTHD